MLPLPGRQRARCPLPCGFGARGRIRTDDLPITSRKAFVQRVCPVSFWLLRSAGSSSQCVPDLPSYGRRNDQRMTRLMRRPADAMPSEAPKRWLASSGVLPVGAP